MKHAQKMVVGVDGSEESLLAVRWAADRAAQCGAELTVACIYTMTSYSTAALDGGLSVLDEETMQGGAQRVLEDAIDLARRPGLDVHGVTEVGNPTKVLTELSSEADMIVIGSHGGTSLTDRIVGSVSCSLPAHAKCPVVVVPVCQSGRPFTPIERIVVGTDGSKVASTALKKAVDEAIWWDARLTVISAVPIPSGVGVMSWMPVDTGRDALLKNMHLSMDNSIKEAVGDAELKVDRHALDGNPAALLAEFSTAVDLVVVGTRGRGGFAGMLLGSTSQTVLNHATCPVMTIPSKIKDKTLSPTQSWERR